MQINLSYKKFPTSFRLFIMYNIFMAANHFDTDVHLIKCLDKVVSNIFSKHLSFFEVWAIVL